jgi:hypothetical protein
MLVGFRRSTDYDSGDDDDDDDNDTVLEPKMIVIIPYGHFQTSQLQKFFFLPSSFCGIAKHTKMNIYYSKLLTVAKQYLFLLVSSNFLY